ncbi:MAG: hypothetical protein Q7O04_00805 [Candidatus Omnitrophota bacterium]|nr:hypothetical protein [Candidatus Omnitrophota bacterium]
MKRKIALFSVNELKGVVEFASILIKNGWSIVATDLACNLLRENNIPADSIADFTGCPEKYKFPPTLHPRMEAALTDNDFSERIELVYDITYGPKSGLDVGGNALLALAVKGRRVPVTSYAAMKSVTEAISKCRDVSQEMRDILISDAAEKIADYYNLVAESVSAGKLQYLRIKRYYDLMNGENPYQKAEIWGMKDNEDFTLPGYQLISDNKPCYTNMADLDSVTETVTKLSCAFRLQYSKQPYITVAAKHGNACGIGVDWESGEASIEKALWGNPLAIWGGEVIVNFKLSSKYSAALISSDKRGKLCGKTNWMLDVISAPEIEDGARLILAGCKNTKLFINKFLYSPELRKQAWDYRFVRGGVIRQSIADFILDISALNWGAKSLPENLDDIIISWAAAFTSFHGGNEIALSRERQLLSCTGGPSTVDAAETAVSRAIKLHGDLFGASFAADAFFPFTDAPLVLVDSGIISGVAPAGGRNQEKIQDFFSGKNIRVGFIPEQFRGFCRH